MRTMLKITLPADAGNEAIADGTLHRVAAIAAVADVRSPLSETP